MAQRGQHANDQIESADNVSNDAPQRTDHFPASL
jgi:hypothetical protein